MVAGPIITSSTPSTVEADQTTVLGNVTPGQAGDVLAIGADQPISGLLSLGPVVDGVQEVLYTAPASILASGAETLSYTVRDDTNSTSTMSGTETVTLDAGPKAVVGTPGALEQRQSEVVGTAIPGESDDTLTLTQTSGAFGTLSLGPATDGGARSITYVAPASIIASGTDVMTYTLTDELGGTVSGTVAVPLDAGPTVAAATPTVVERGQTTVVGTVAAGISGDTLTLHQAFGSLGRLSLGPAQNGVENVIYTAPATVAASTPDHVAYTVSDQHDDVVASGANTVTFDGGPVFSAGTPSVVENGQTTVLGTVTPGVAGDSLTLTQVKGGLGTVSLGAVQSDGSQQVIYTAPTHVAASALDTVSYTIIDQHDDATVNQTASVSLDAGPSITSAAPVTVEHNQTTILGTVTAGIAGDTLTLSQTTGSLGTVSLAAVVDGAQQILYTAPSDVSASGPDAVSYSITDQHDGAVASGSATVTLDVGPAIAPATPATLERNQTTVLGVVTPGIAGDTLTLAQAPGALGTVSLGAAQADGTQQVIYTAPATVAASGNDDVSYTVADQHGAVIAQQSAAINLDAGPTIAIATPATVEQSQTTILGTVTPGEAGDTLSVFQVPGALGAVSLGAAQADGTQQVIYTAPASVAASGNDSVTYVVSDQYHDAVSVNSATVALDAGPAIAAATPAAIEQGQTTVLGAVTPGIAGDTLSVAVAAGALGTVALGAVQSNGTQQVIYTAPASVATSGVDTVSYSIVDQHGAVVASKSASVTLDAGPAVSPVTAAAEQGQTTVIGIVTAGEPGDTLTLAQSAGGLGTVALGAAQANGTQQVLYTAPASVTASGNDAVSYSITDQHTDAVSKQTASVSLDAGPAITSATPASVQASHTTVLGTVMPGMTGDALAISQAPGAQGAVSLGAAQSGGSQQIIYTAPASITTNATDTISYSVIDQHDDAVAKGSDVVSLQAGPIITPTTPSVIEGYQTTVLGTVLPGVVGDTLSITGSKGMYGSVSLGAVQPDGSQQVIYTPPGDDSGSSVANFTYIVTDQNGGGATSQAASVTVDGGPTVSPQTAPGVLEQGQNAVLATVSPGEPDDTLSVRQTGGAPGIITLGAAQSDGTRQVIYTAPASITATGNEAVSYEVTDQHGSLSSDGSANIALAIMPFAGLMVSDADAAATMTVSLTMDASGGSFADLGTGSVSGGTYTVSGTAAQVNTALHGLGFTSSTAGVSSPTFSVNFAASGTTATLYGSSGADHLIGANAKLSMVGSGAGTTVTADASGGEILVAGSGGETLDGGVAGSGDVFYGAASGSTIFQGGAGHDTMIGGGGNSTVVSGAGGSVIFLGSGGNLVQSNGADTIIGTSGRDTISAGGSSVRLFAGSGSTDFNGGAARSTVIGGAGAVTVSGGAGGGAFYGSAAGGNLLQSGTGNAFLVAGGNGDRLVATGGASDILLAASGNETLNASGSTASDLLYGGSGADAISLGAGRDTLLAGSGSAAVTVGSGSAMLDFVAGHDGGAMTVTGFKAGTDHVALFGYDSGEAASVLQNAVVSGGNTALTLSDGTHITLLGVTDLGTQSIV